MSLYSEKKTAIVQMGRAEVHRAKRKASWINLILNIHRQIRSFRSQMSAFIRSSVAELCIDILFYVQHLQSTLGTVTRPVFSIFFTRSFLYGQICYLNMNDCHKVSLGWQKQFGGDWKYGFKIISHWKASWSAGSAPVWSLSLRNLSSGKNALALALKIFCKLSMAIEKY